MCNLQALSTNDATKVGQVLANSFSKIKFQQYLDNGTQPFEESLKQWTTKSQEFIDAGAEVIQAEDYSAVAIWIPPNLKLPKPSDEPNHRMKKIFSSFKEAEDKHFKNRPHWGLMFLARDPSKNTKGSVSALVKPILQRAEDEGIPASLYCVDEHAKGVYLHWGFEVLETVPVGVGEVNEDNEEDENGTGFNVYLMAYNYRD